MAINRGNSVGRNRLVELAVEQAISQMDAFLSGETVALPSSEYRRKCDDLLREKSVSASVKTAVLYLVFYWLQDPEWDLNTLPVGSRGTFGDKRLCEELSKRSITLHGYIIAYGENLGWKGNVKGGNVNLRKDSRFSKFLDGISSAPTEERERIASCLAYNFANSRKEITPMPPVDAKVLIFTRAKALFHQLVHLPSEGYIQQFVIAALLYNFRQRQGIEVTTHRPHTADRFDETARDTAGKSCSGLRDYCQK